MIRFMATFLAVSALGQPRIQYNIDAAAQAGIEVYHEGRYGFAQHLNRMANDQTGLSDISPSMFFMKNTSDRNIDSTVVIYRFKLPGDPAVRQSFFILAHNIRASHFHPGELYAVYPGAGTVGPDSLNLNPNTLRLTRNWLSHVTDVRVSLDAVIFENGELVGPNTSGIDVRWNAERNAAKEIYREYLASSDREGYINSLLDSKSDPAVNIPDLMRHVPTWDAYARKMIGRMLLEVEETDRASTLERISRNYPELHTKRGETK